MDEELPSSIVKNLFLAHLALEIHLPPTIFWEIMQPLQTHFKDSIYIKSQLAMAYYNALGKTKIKGII